MNCFEAEESRAGNKTGVPGVTRTPDPLLRRQLLYPLSYRDVLGPAHPHFSTPVKDLTSVEASFIIHTLLQGFTKGTIIIS